MLFDWPKMRRGDMVESLGKARMHCDFMQVGRAPSPERMFLCD